MRIKKLLIIGISISTLLAACKKDNVTGPASNRKNPPVMQPPTSPTFTISNLLQSNMVIQRDAPFQVWGIADAGRSVSVTVSWNTDTFKTTADKTGTWKVTIPAAPANSTGQTITCSSNGFNDITLNNVLIGDVWVCSGQSNMVMPVNVLPPSFSGVLDYQNEIAAANYPEIRALTLSPTYSDYPLNLLAHNDNWSVCSPQTAGNLSAVAYFFARKLNISLHIPIGIIVSAVNGAPCQQWANYEIFNNPAISSYAHRGSVSYLFNGMISPLTSLSIKGFTWYQGESNMHDNPSAYAKLNSALINGWRDIFNQGRLPFYFVQMTPFAEDYNLTTPKGGNPLLNDYAKFREGQASILAVPGTGMAVTMDVGEADNHHPRNKKPVGERLALLALKNTYNQGVTCYGPRYSYYIASGSTIIVHFIGGTADGLNTINDQSLNQLFFVAGTDHVFRQGSAYIQNNTVVITASTDTPLPVQAIRYAFTNAPITNLQNAAGLPAEPFRTDNWSN